MPTPDFSGVTWRKSTRSSGNAECVEIAHLPGLIGIRDSKHSSAGQALTFPIHAWSTFTTMSRPS